MSSSRSKQGSTLLLTICLFLVFMIFAFALIPLSRHAFEKTAYDVEQQQAVYVARSAAETLVSQLGQEAMQEVLKPVLDTGQSYETEWFDFGDQGARFRYTVSRDETSWVSSPSAWDQADLKVTAIAEVNGKTASLSAVIQARRMKNVFHDPDYPVTGTLELQRVLLVNECRTPTEASASFWINAISDKEVTEENQPDSGVSSPEQPDGERKPVSSDAVREQPVMIYRNIRNLRITGTIEADLVLEPAEFTKAEIGGAQAGSVTITGDVYCKGDLILNNAAIEGNIYVSGKLEKRGLSSVSGTVIEQTSSDLLAPFDEAQPMLTKLEADYGTTVDGDEVVIDTSLKDDLVYTLTSSTLKHLTIRNQSLDRNYFVLKTLPESIEILSDYEGYRPVFYIEDPAPVLTDQVAATLLAGENVILVFENPVRIQASQNLSVFAPEILFEASDLRLSGRYQACRFENAQLVTEMNLRGRNTTEYFYYPKMKPEADVYYFDLRYYEGQGE